MKKKVKHIKQDDDDTVPNPSTSSSIDTEIDSNPEQNVNASHEFPPPAHTGNEQAHQHLEQIFWSKSTNDEDKTREEEFDEYLADLLL